MVVVADRVVVKKDICVFLKQDNLVMPSVWLEMDESKKAVAWVLFYPVLYVLEAIPRASEQKYTYTFWCLVHAPHIIFFTCTNVHKQNTN